MQDPSLWEGCQCDTVDLDRRGTCWCVDSRSGKYSAAQFVVMDDDETVEETCGKLQCANSKYPHLNDSSSNSKDSSIDSRDSASDDIDDTHNLTSDNPYDNSNYSTTGHGSHDSTSESPYDDSPSSIISPSKHVLLLVHAILLLFAVLL